MHTCLLTNNPHNQPTNHSPGTMMSLRPSAYRSVMRGVAYTLDDTSVIHLSSMSSGHMLLSGAANSSNLFGAWW